MRKNLFGKSQPLWLNGEKSFVDQPRGEAQLRQISAEAQKRQCLPLSPLPSRINLGSAARTKTPTIFCVSSSPKASISARSLRHSSIPLSISSTTVRASASGGSLLPKFLLHLIDNLPARAEGTGVCAISNSVDIKPSAFELGVTRCTPLFLSSANGRCLPFGRSYFLFFRKESNQRKAI